jgi:hypothetical protein
LVTLPSLYRGGHLRAPKSTTSTTLDGVLTLRKGTDSGGLEIAMYDPRGVGLGQPHTFARRKVDRIVDGERAALAGGAARSNLAPLEGYSMTMNGYSPESNVPPTTLSSAVCRGACLLR